MNMQQHWENVYGTKTPDQVSWFRPHLETSLALIERAARDNRAASIIDVGGGASTLIDDLLERQYWNVTVADISQAALEITQTRLGKRAESVRWRQADVTQTVFPPDFYDIWHDRAVFHFLTKLADRIAYVQNVARAVKPGGHVIVGTFGPEGPTQCSNLDVMRYDTESLHGEFGSHFRLVESFKELHDTPSGIKQQFLYCYCRLEQ